jgi:RNA polymerase sigma factor (sigma-70 family)
MLTAQQQRDVESVVPIVRSVIGKTFVPDDVDYDDIAQYVMVEVCRARLRYDPTRGAKFSTFASHRIRGAVIDYLREHSVHRHYVTLDELDDRGAGPVAPPVMGLLEFTQAVEEKAAERELRRKNFRPGLSPRRLELLHHLCDGLSNKEIAARMGTSIKTVDHQRGDLFKHIGVHNVALVVRWAIREGHVVA